MSSSDREQAVVGAVPTELFINSRWRPGSGGKTFDVEDPSTGKVLREVADALSRTAWPRWTPRWRAGGGRAPTARARRDPAPRLRADDRAQVDELALLMTLEMGKPLAEAEGEVAYAAEFFRWFAEEAVRIDGDYATAPSGVGRLLVMRQPVGPCC